MVSDALLLAVSRVTKSKVRSYREQGRNHSSLERQKGGSLGLVFFSCLGPDYDVSELQREGSRGITLSSCQSAD